MIDDLLKLSKIFKEGYTVELKNNELTQYNDYNKPYIVSYLTLIEIHHDKTLYNNVQHIPDKCIIGGWLDHDNNVFYIELNKAFKHKDAAVYHAKLYSQKAIYNIRTRSVINL